MSPTSAVGALDGIRVVDLSRTAAGPLCTQMLGDLGADVIKVEERGTGDETRMWEPRWGPESTYFLAFNRNKRSITLDLSKPESREVCRRLIAGADVLVESFRTGVMEGFHLAYDDLVAEHPQLVYCSISSFGRTGPKSGWRGYEAIAEAFGGLMSVTGFQGGPPVRAGFSVLDHATGLLAYGGVLTALLARERTGRGQHVETSLLDASVSAMSYHAFAYWATGAEPVPHGSAHAAFAPYEAIATADGYLQVGVGNDRLWHRYCAAAGCDDLRNDPRFVSNSARVENRPELIAILRDRLSTRTAAEWEQVFSAAGVPCSEVRTVSRVLSDEQVAARGHGAATDHPKIADFRSLGMAVHYSDTPGAMRRPPPALGAHTDEILAELGFDETERDTLRGTGAV